MLANPFISAIGSMLYKNPTAKGSEADGWSPAPASHLLNSIAPAEIDVVIKDPDRALALSLGTE